MHTASHLLLILFSIESVLSPAALTIFNTEHFQITATNKYVANERRGIKKTQLIS